MLLFSSFYSFLDLDPLTDDWILIQSESTGSTDPTESWFNPKPGQYPVNGLNKTESGVRIHWHKLNPYVIRIQSGWVTLILSYLRTVYLDYEHKIHILKSARSRGSVQYHHTVKKPHCVNVQYCTYPSIQSWNRSSAPHPVVPAGVAQGKRRPAA